MSSAACLKEVLDTIIYYFNKHSALANFHMVDYFTRNGFQEHIPRNIRTEIEETGYNETIAHIFGSHVSDMPALDDYLACSKKFTLKYCPTFCMSTDDFQSKLKEWGCEKFPRFKMPIFMTSKKSHEVDVLSFIAAAMKDISGTSHLIDIGDGKGYLSSMLSLFYNIPVLGVDASRTNTNGSIERVRKLARVWNSVVNSDKANLPKSDLYKQVTQYVDANMDFKELVNTVFLSEPTSLGLVGLHTCGNLAPNSLRIFCCSEDIRTVCNVGCCYHLIDEQFDPENGKDSGFPMSNYLQEKELLIGRSARMIAAQSVERIIAKKEYPSKTIFYRAVFEILIERKCPDLSKKQRIVGRFRKVPVHFKDYVRQAMDRINFSGTVSDSEIDNLYSEYAYREKEVYLFNLIRNMLAPVVESLILLDRLLYLYENGYTNSYLVHLFDPVVSPRCYGIVAMKDV